MYDTPGILHPHQLTTRVPATDLRLLLPRKQLAPRTFLVRAGQSLSIGASARVDVVDGERALLTLWASADVAHHLGKAEGAAALRDKHAGGLLQPPSTPEAAADLGGI